MGQRLTAVMRACPIGNNQKSPDRNCSVWPIRYFIRLHRRAWRCGSAGTSEPSIAFDVDQMPFEPISQNAWPDH